MNHPHHSLATIRAKIDAGDVVIRTNAIQTASDDFGWSAAEILKCIKKLRNTDFHKTVPHHSDPQRQAQVDYYKASSIMGESVYTHFYIDSVTNKLVISSFKRI